MTTGTKPRRSLKTHLVIADTDGAAFTGCGARAEMYEAGRLTTDKSRVTCERCRRALLKARQAVGMAPGPDALTGAGAELSTVFEHPVDRWAEILIAWRDAAVAAERANVPLPDRDDLIGALERVPLADGWMPGMVADAILESLPARPRLPAIQTERDRAVPAAQLLARRIDQLIGWAKSGKIRDRDDPDVEYYLMDTGNVDPLRDHILHVVADCGYRAVAVPAREPIAPSGGGGSVSIIPESDHAEMPGYAPGHWDYPRRCADVESALAAARERAGEWDKDTDPHGWWHERPDWIALHNEVLRLRGELERAKLGED